MPPNDVEVALETPVTSRSETAMQPNKPEALRQKGPLLAG